LVIFLIVS